MEMYFEFFEYTIYDTFLNLKIHLKLHNFEIHYKL